MNATEKKEEMVETVRNGYLANSAGCETRLYCDCSCESKDCASCPVSGAKEKMKKDCAASASALDEIVMDNFNGMKVEKATRQFILTIRALCEKMKKYDACGDNECNGFCHTRKVLEKALVENGSCITDEQLMLFAEMQWTVNGFADDDLDIYVWFDSEYSTILNPFIDESGRFPYNMQDACREYGRDNVEEWCRKATEFIMNFEGYPDDEDDEEDEE